MFTVCKDKWTSVWHVLHLLAESTWDAFGLLLTTVFAQFLTLPLHFETWDRLSVGLQDEMASPVRLVSTDSRLHCLFGSHHNWDWWAQFYSRVHSWERDSRNRSCVPKGVAFLLIVYIYTGSNSIVKVRLWDLNRINSELKKFLEVPINLIEDIDVCENVGSFTFRIFQLPLRH